MNNRHMHVYSDDPLNFQLQAREMAALAEGPADLSLVPGTHDTGERTLLALTSFSPTSILVL